MDPEPTERATQDPDTAGERQGWRLIGGEFLIPPMVSAWRAQLKLPQALGALGCGCIFAVGALVVAIVVLGGLLTAGPVGGFIAFVLIFASMFVGLNLGISVAVRLLTRKR